MDQYLEATKEIVLKMIESNKFAFKNYSSVNKDYSEVNTFNINEVCKAFKTVYQTVTKPTDE